MLPEAQSVHCCTCLDEPPPRANLPRTSAPGKHGAAWQAVPRLTSTQGCPREAGHVEISSLGAKGGWQ